MHPTHPTPYRFLPWLLLSALVAACGTAGTDPGPAPGNPSELLVKTWRISEELLNGAPSGVNTSPYRITYKADGTYSETSSQGVSATGTWAFAGNNSAIVYNQGGTGERREEITLTATTLDRRYATQNYKSGNVSVQMKMVPVP